MNHRKLQVIVLTTLLVVAGGPALASGFAIIEASGTGQGNAYAGAAAHPRNASTVFFNPAGLTYLDGQQIVIAGHYINAGSEFTNNGSALAPALTNFGAAGPLAGPNADGGQSALVPNFYWARPLNEKLTFGLGVNAPFGLAIEYDDGWVGRYHALLSDLATININPSIGYRVNERLSIGGGINVLLAHVELTNAIDFGSLCYGLNFDFNGSIAQCVGASANPQAVDGRADLEGDNYGDPALGFNFGLMFDATEKTHIGVTYRSELEVEVEGDADFTVPTNSALDLFLPAAGLFEDSPLEAEVTLPASASLSVAHRFGRFTGLADVSYTGWSSFDELRIDFSNPSQPDSVTTEDWDDTLRYSLGFDFERSEKTTLRAGVALDETPVPSAERRTPRLPGNDRMWYSIGLSRKLNERLSLDVGASYIEVDDATINNEFESGVSTLNHSLTGTYEADVTILSFQLNWDL